MAMQPVPQYYRKPYQKLDGGLSTRPSQLNVPANKFVQLDNAILADHDILEKAQGYVIDGSPFSATDPAAFIRMLSDYRVGSSFDSIIVAAHNNLGTTATSGSLTTIGSPITDTSSYVAPFNRLVMLIDSTSVGDVFTITGISGSTGYQIAASIQSAVLAAGYTGFTCVFNGTEYIMTSGTAGVSSRVRVYNWDWSGHNCTAAPYNFSAALRMNDNISTPSQGQVDIFLGNSGSPSPTPSSPTLVVGSAAVPDEATYLVDFKQSVGDGNYYYIGYTVGTALFTNGSTSVVGTSTIWATNIKAGDKIGVGAMGFTTQPTKFYQVASVTNDTHIVLTSNFLETTTLAVPYLALIRMNDNNIPASLVFNNKIIIGNGADSVMEYDNTTMLLLPALPEAGLFCLHKNRVFMAGVSAAPSSIYWTHVNDETAIESGSVAPVYAQDNGNIVAIVSFANSLIVLKDNGRVYQVTGDFDQDVIGSPTGIRRIDTQDNIGIIAGRTAVVNDDNKLYFLAQTGYYTITGNYGYMVVEKISWDIQPTLQNLIFKSSVSTADQFAFSSKAQWSTGTLTGTSASRIANSISPFFDNTQIPGSQQANKFASTFIDANNDVHTASVSSDGTTVLYTKWLALDNTQFSQTVVVPATFLSFAATINAVAISVSSSDGRVGIATTTQFFQFGSPSSVTYTTIYSEFTSGTWNSFKAYQSGQVPSGAISGGSSGLSINFNGTDPRICFNNPYPAFNQAAIIYTFRSAGSFSAVSFGGPTGPVASYYKDVSMTTDVSGNVYVAAVTTPGAYGLGYSVVDYWYSSNGGASFSNPLTSSSLGVPYLTPSGSSPAYGTGNISMGLNDLNDAIIVYNFNGYTTGDGGNIVRYNVTPNTPVKETSVTGATMLGYTNQALGAQAYYYISSNEESLKYDITYNTGTATFISGNSSVTGQGTKWTTWVKPGDLIRLASDVESDYATVLTINSDTSITLTATYAGSSGSTSAYISKRPVTISNPTTGNINYYSMAGVSSNGSVLGLCAFSSSANIVNVRRLTAFGKFKSPLLSNASLTSWGAFIVSGADSAGGSILYEIGVSTSSTILVINTNLITSGTTISTNTSADFAQLTITFQLGTFAQSYVNSAVLNYNALVVDSKLPTAYVYNNEMYVGLTQTGFSGNNIILFFDRNHAWMDFLYGATCFARMSSNQVLYGGSATNGQVLKVRQGYTFGGANYSMVAVTKEDMLGSLELTKDIYKAYVQFVAQSGGKFTFSYRLDDYASATPSPWFDTVVDQTVNGFIDIPIGQSCSSIQFKVQQDGSNFQCGFIGFTLLYNYLNLR